MPVIWFLHPASTTPLHRQARRRTRGVGSFDHRAFLDFFWLIPVRRPAVAAALSLVMITIIITLSQFKFNVLDMTLSFFDVLIIDADTIVFLLTIFPDLPAAVAVAAIAALVLIWRLDRFRLRMRTAICGTVLSLAAMAALPDRAAALPHMEDDGEALVLCPKTPRDRTAWLG